MLFILYWSFKRYHIAFMSGNKNRSKKLPCLACQWKRAIIKWTFLPCQFINLLIYYQFIFYTFFFVIDTSAFDPGITAKPRFPISAGSLWSCTLTFNPISGVDMLYSYTWTLRVSWRPLLIPGLVTNSNGNFGGPRQKAKRWHEHIAIVIKTKKYVQVIVIPIIRFPTVSYEVLF